MQTAIPASVGKITIRAKKENGEIVYLD